MQSANSVLFIYFLLPLIYSQELTRPIDLWNPFGTTTTRRPGMVLEIVFYLKYLFCVLRTSEKMK